MEWQALSLRLALTGDLHCGSLPLGFVSRTYPYVPCHIPVFALVPAAVRVLGMPDRHASYAAVEALFASCLRCTPLYVDDPKDGILFPWEEQGLRRLEHGYISSSYGVSLDSATRSAIDSHLYETEAILACGRNRSAPTVLAGALFLRAGEAEGLAMKPDGAVQWSGRSAALEELLCVMQIGGDRGRSLGKPAIPSVEPLQGRLWQRYEAECSGPFPALLVPAGTPGPMPLACEGTDAAGARIVLTGRRHRGTGFGEDMEAAVVAFDAGWTSGTNVRAELSALRCARAV